jgi:hypothetical protein
LDVLNLKNLFFISVKDTRLPATDRNERMVYLMKKIYLAQFVISAGMIVGTPSLAGVYTYEVRSIDTDLGEESCRAMISDAAAKFQAGAGVSLISSGCEKDGVLGSLTGTIAYSATERVMPWSTMSTTYGEEIDFYVSRQQCEDALVIEVEFFNKLTNLTPFISFCHKTSEIGPPRYRTRIDALGSTDIRRYESSAVTYYPLQDANAAVTTLHQQATDLNLRPVAWYQGPVRSLRGLSVAYYAVANESPFRLLSKSLRYYSTLQDCEAARTSFEQTKITEWVGVTACSVAHPTVGFQLNILFWDRSLGADLILRSTLLPGSHTSLAECRTAATELSSRLAQSGEKVVGIACGRDDSAQSPIKMELITKSR